VRRDRPSDAISALAVSVVLAYAVSPAQTQRSIESSRISVTAAYFLNTRNAYEAIELQQRYLLRGDIDRRYLGVAHRRAG
jgi:hypothetical protein